MYSLITTTLPYLVFFGWVYFYLNEKRKVRETEEKERERLVELEDKLIDTQEEMRYLASFVGYDVQTMPAERRDEGNE